MAPARAVAVLGDQRDGHRSDLHHACPPCRSSPRSAARRRCRPPIARCWRACARVGAIDYADVRRLKQRALRAAFERFRRRRVAPRHRSRAGVRDASSASRRGGSTTTRCSARSTRSEDERPWTEWPAALQRREPAALDACAPRARARGPVPPVPAVAGATRSGSRRARSRTAWRCSATCRSWWTATAPTSGRGRISSASTSRVGAPPDAFSATGQDWGMPVYRWDVIAHDDFRWLRERARRSADLYDGYRVDHLVGFYRTYGRPRDGGDAVFHAGDEPDQLALGERVLDRLPRSRRGRSSPRISASCPTSCARRWRGSACPASACFRWERHWHAEGQPFRDPSDYPARVGRRRPGRTTPKRWPCGGTSAPPRNAGRSRPADRPAASTADASG